MYEHRRSRFWRTGLVVGGLLATTAPAALAQQSPPSAEEMWEIIQRQQQEIEELRSRLERTDERVEQTDQKVEATGEIAQEMISMRAPDADRGFLDRTSLGGYGELHYNGGDKDEIDFHRFVLFIGHEFNDRIRLFSEVEIEHADTGRNGAVELEQAWIEFDITPTQHALAGLFLIPVGILNEVHEPPTFFGVERNEVESQIIPTTWWEGGAGMHGEIGYGFSYIAAVHSGLKTDETFDIRGGRRKVSEAEANDFAATARVRWTGMPGVMVGVSGQYQDDLTQGEFGVSATLFEAHTDIRRGPFGFRGLYARWDLEDGPPAIGPEAIGRDKQYGWYVEPAFYMDAPGLGGPGEFGIFGRFQQFDESAGDDINSKVDIWQIGANYWPHPNVVLKADFQFEDKPILLGEDDDRINLGIGYQF